MHLGGPCHPPAVLGVLLPFAELFTCSWPLLLHNWLPVCDGRRFQRDLVSSKQGPDVQGLGRSSPSTVSSPKPLQLLGLPCGH